MRTLALCGVSLALAVGCAKTAAAPPAATAQAAPDASLAPAAQSTRPSGGPADPRAASSSDALVGRTWRLAGGAAATASPSSVPTITFETPQQVTGSTGCNRFSATVAMTDASFRIGPMMATRRGCPAPVMEQEKSFVGALEAVRAWRRASSGAELLELLDESGAVLLKLEPVPPNEKTRSR